MYLSQYNNLNTRGHVLQQDENSREGLRVGVQHVVLAKTGYQFEKQDTVEHHVPAKWCSAPTHSAAQCSGSKKKRLLSNTFMTLMKVNK